MKQLTLTNVLTAFSDEPKSIGDRLTLLGLDKSEFKKSFSKEILLMTVYGTSFLKFLQENSAKFALDDKIPAEPLPADFKNPFEDGEMKVSERLAALEMSGDEAKELFGDDVLNMSVNAREFEDLLVKNQDKLLGKLKDLATQGGTNG